MDFENFTKLHENQLTSSGVPKHFWKSLFTKLSSQTFDIGQYVQLTENEEPLNNLNWCLTALEPIEKSNENHVFLIDHAWTYRIEDAQKYLSEYDSLRSRLCGMLGIEIDLEEVQTIIEQILENQWKLNNFYTIQNGNSIEDRLPIWYIMDEIGSAVGHSKEFNCRIVPFISCFDQCAYSILFPVKRIEPNDILTRDFAEGIEDSLLKKAMLLPWIEGDFKNVNFEPSIPGAEYYLDGHKEESLPDNSKKISLKSKVKVFTEYDLIKEYLKDSKFEIVEEREDADILWLTSHFKDFDKLNAKFVNQFPFEFVITVKDLLCMTCRRWNRAKYTEDPLWIPKTYNLTTELPNFISYFQQNNSDNYWIIKPYNLARSLDIHITNNLNHIIRLRQTGPKIIQKYLTSPILFHRPECNGKVKFDIRYVILLKSVKPLKMFVYKNFFLRFANKPFELKNFNNYETHFTVMNYNENTILKRMLCNEFKENWKIQYESYDWQEIENSILKMFRSVFECATKEKPPCGIAESVQSRALYAADLMLEMVQGDIKPRLLEINFTPDCQRACEYYYDFYNDVFNVLFFDEKCDKFYEL